MKKITYAASIVGVIAALSLTACGDKTDVNEGNFKAALDQYFEKSGDLCLGILGFPQEVNTKHTEGDSHLQLASLEKAGLLKSEDVIVSPAWSNKVKDPGKRYTPTEAAQPYLRETAYGDGKKTDLCWGKMRVEKITKWNAPEFNRTRVYFTYKIDDLADWAQNKEIQELLASGFDVGHFGGRFPMKSTIEEAVVKEDFRALHLTNLGWEA